MRASLLQTAQQYFQHQNWAFERVADEPTLKLSFGGKNGRFHCLFVAKEEVAQAIFFSICPVPVEQSKYAAVAELFMRVNCGLNVGAFEFNFDNGMARFRTGVDLDDVAEPIYLIRNMVLMNVTTMDRYTPALNGVLNGQSPIDALRSKANHNE